MKDWQDDFKKYMFDSFKLKKAYKLLLDIVLRRPCQMLDFFDKGMIEPLEKGKANEFSRARHRTGRRPVSIGRVHGSFAPGYCPIARLQLRQRHADRILACLHGHFHNGIRGWRDHGQTVEVLSGLLVGDQLVVSGQEYLRDRQPVIITEKLAGLR